MFWEGCGSWGIRIKGLCVWCVYKRVSRGLELFSSWGLAVRGDGMVKILCVLSGAR